MYGSVIFQINEIWKTSKRSSILHTYRDVWIKIGKYAKENYKISDMEQIKGEFIQSYLESMTNTGCDSTLFNHHVVAAEILELSLNDFAKNKKSGATYHFQENIQNAKTAHIDFNRFNGYRAYDDPLSIIEAIENSAHKLFAQIQLESGSRASECTSLNKDNLRGLKNDPVTGQKKGAFYVKQAKGGKSGEKYILPATYNILEEQISKLPENTSFINIGEYRKSLKKTAKITNQRFCGINGIAMNYFKSFVEIHSPGGKT
jgi:integrase